MIRAYNPKEFKRNLNLIFYYNPNIPGESIQRIFFGGLPSISTLQRICSRMYNKLNGEISKGLSKRYELLSPDATNTPLFNTRNLIEETHLYK